MRLDSGGERLVCGDLLQVPALVADVVLDQEAEGYGGFVADDAALEVARRGQIEGRQRI